MDRSERRVSLLCIELIRYNVIYSIDISLTPQTLQLQFHTLVSLLPHLTTHPLSYSYIKFSRTASELAASQKFMCLTIYILGNVSNAPETRDRRAGTCT